MELIRTLGDWVREHADAIWGDDDDDNDELPDDGSIQTVTDAIEWLGFPLRSQNWPALWRLFERPYLTRVWIIQELAANCPLLSDDPTALSSGLILWGTSQAERHQYNHVCILLVFMMASGKTVHTGGNTHEMDEPFRSLLRGTGHPPGLTMVQVLTGCTGSARRDLEFILRATPMFKATDPRDKLYSLLGLAADGDMLRADYTISYEQLVRSFVWASIRKSNSLRVLLGNRYREAPSGLPSWAPDLLYKDPEFGINRGLTPVMDNGFFQAAGFTRVVVPSLDARTTTTPDYLSCRGILVGEVRKVIGPLRVARSQFDWTAQNAVAAYTSMGQKEVFEALRDFYHRLPAQSAPNKSSKDTFWRTLCLDGDWCELNPVFPAPADFAQQHRVVFGYESVPAEFMPQETENRRHREFVHRFGASMSAALSNRTFIETKDGRVGIGPYLAQEGDVVVILFGAPFCLVLRPEGVGQYRLVGDAYVHGVMHGELIESRSGQMFDIV